MRRLEQHQQKQFRTTVIMLIIAFVIVVYFIFSVGFKILLSTSSFISTLTSKKPENSQTKPEDTFGSISIDSIPSATNSAKINITGSVINFNQIEFYINGEKVKEISLSSSDNFNEVINNLEKGANEIFIKGKIKGSSSEKASKIYAVLYKSEKPKLEISEPQDKAKISKNEVNIKGSTDKETFIKINDLPIVVDAQGNFQTSIRLKDGENKINIRAEDVAGNIEMKDITVIYQKED